MNRNKLRRKWLWTGGIGASLTGVGLCAVVESAFLKHEGADLLLWVGAGTLSLAVFMLGIVLLIKSGLMETRLEVNKEE